MIRAGTLWGALEAVAERDPRSTTQNAMCENTPYVEVVQGPDFEKVASAAGRSRWTRRSTSPFRVAAERGGLSAAPDRPPGGNA